jgi:hypothetical protein
MKDSDKLWRLCCAVFRENERTEPGISYSSTVSGSASTKCTESGGICSTGGWDAGTLKQCTLNVSLVPVMLG